VRHSQMPDGIAFQIGGVPTENDRRANLVLVLGRASRRASEERRDQTDTAGLITPLVLLVIEQLILSAAI